MYNIPNLFIDVGWITESERTILLLSIQQKSLILASPPASGYTSIAHPAYADKLTSKYPAAQQMKSVGWNCKEGEEVMPPLSLIQSSYLQCWEKETVKESHWYSDINLNTKIREMNQYDNHPIIPAHHDPCFLTWGVKIKRHPMINGLVNLKEHFVNHWLGSWRKRENLVICYT